MDKRAILFLILSVAILYLYSYYEYQQKKNRLERFKREPAALEPPPPGLPLPQAPTDAKRDQVPDEKSLLSDDIAIEQEVVVETDLYRAIFTNRGGVIKHWELKQYTKGVDKDSPRIILFGPQKKEPAIFPLEIFVEGEAEQVQQRFLKGLYRIEGQNLKLQGPTWRGYGPL